MKFLLRNLSLNKGRQRHQSLIINRVCLSNLSQKYSLNEDPALVFH